MRREIMHCVARHVGHPGADRPHLPAGDDRRGAGAVPRQGQRQPGSGRARGGGRLRADRPGASPTPPMCRGACPRPATATTRRRRRGSNLGPTSKKLRDRVAADVERLRKENPDAPLPGPGGAGDGLGQRARPGPVAAGGALAGAAHRARAPGRARAHRAGHREPSQGRDLGVFGEPRVNVLVLNLALDAQFGKPAPLPPATPPTSAAK